MSPVFLARELYSPLQKVDRPLGFVEDGVVTEVTSSHAREVPRGAQAIELGDAILAPGFIDMHIHGGAGRDVMDPAEDGLPAVERLLCSHGVTKYFPSHVT